MDIFVRIFVNIFEIFLISNYKHFCDFRYFNPYNKYRAFKLESNMKLVVSHNLGAIFQLKQLLAIKMIVAQEIEMVL